MWKLQKAAAGFIAPTPLADATTEQLLHWWATLPNTADSRNQGRKALCAFYISLEQETGGRRRGARSIRTRTGSPSPLSAAAFDAFLNAADNQASGRTRVLGFLLAYSGCRHSEACGARSDQFDLSAAPPRWWISGKGSGRRGPKERCVPVHSRLAAVLAEWTTPGARPGGARPAEDRRVLPLGAAPTFGR